MEQHPIQFSAPTNEDNFNLLDTVSFKGKTVQLLQNILSGQNVPIIKTDSSGIDWVRVGFNVTQTEANSGAAVNLENLRLIYNLEHQIGEDGEFASYLREYVAISNGRCVGTRHTNLVPVETS